MSDAEGPRLCVVFFKPSERAESPVEKEYREAVCQPKERAKIDALLRRLAPVVQARPGGEVKNTKASIDPRAIGRPIEALVHEGMKDPAYRRHYMLYQVRASIASVVQSLRKARGMTQAELAKRAGVPQPQIARLEGLSDERIPRSSSSGSSPRWTAARP